MIEKFNFYIKHAFNDMRVNGQRTFFAILCIAAGVAAIVSLQTLAVMIEQTLTGNLQQQNLGDISAEFADVSLNGMETPEEDGGPFGPTEPRRPVVDPEVRRQAIQEDQERGYLATREQGFGGVNISETRLTGDGLEALRSTLREAFPDQNGESQVEVTFRMLLVDFGQVFIGTGDGVNVEVLGLDTFLSNHSPLAVDTSMYPFYDTVITQDGDTLQEVFTSYEGDGYGIVFSADSAQDLSTPERELQVGDTVRLSGSTADFTVLGIVPTDTEIRDLVSGFQLGLFGYYYYIDARALETFDNMQLLVDEVYVRVADNAIAEDVADVMQENFPYLELQTTEDLRQQNEEIAEDLDTLVTVMGLLSLLLGSIGIINTMQVVVRRRTLEIAVLKTIGMQGRQVTLLFLMQAFIMGVIGSVFGVLLGWVTVFVIRGTAEGVLRQGLEFTIAAEPVINGVIVGTMVTTVFGFLPTLSAGQVRPGVVLRPNDAAIPRAGIIASLVTIFAMVLVLSLIAQGILGGNFSVALAAVAGAFFGAGLIFVMLWVLIWFVGRFFPSLGVVDLKLSKRQLLASKRRGAITLLALVVAVFSLSTITLFADSFTNLLNSLLNAEGAEPVYVQAALPSGLDRAIDIVEEHPDVESYTVNRTFNDVQFLSLQKADGTRINSEQALLDRADPGSQEEQFNNTFTLGLLGAYEPDQAPYTELVQGTTLENAESDLPPLVVPESAFTNAGLFEVGDMVSFRIGGQKVDFELVGIQSFDPLNLSFTVATQFVRWEDMQALGLEPDNINLSVAMPEERVGSLRRDLGDISGLFVLDTRTFSNLIDVLLEQFRAFPTMVALLGLVVGGVVIANSVALATLERRQQIAVMKSVGLQRERVLGMLLLENGLLGLVGGLLGVGTGLITLVIISGLIDLPLDVIPFGVAFLLMALCIVVALVAAMTTAWGASGEKPLNVLRYE
ncbi:MAG: FtsX-like permease family protein [Chloroflexota bacterium]